MGITHPARKQDGGHPSDDHFKGWNKIMIIISI